MKPASSRPITLNVYGPGKSCVRSSSSKVGRYSTPSPSGGRHLYILSEVAFREKVHKTLAEPAAVVAGRYFPQPRRTRRRGDGRLGRPGDGVQVTAVQDDLHDGRDALRQTGRRAELRAQGGAEL